MQIEKSAGRLAGPGWVLAGVCLAALMLPMCFTGGALATPAIGREFGGSATALNWVVNAFMLAFGSSLMTAGAWADQLGRRRVFCMGVILFVASSLLISMAAQLFWLNIMRAAQGLAGAFTLASGTAALAQEFEGRARTRAFAAIGTTFGIGLAAGPVLGGLLIQTFGWRAAFLTCATLGVLALLLAVPRMRESRDPQAAGLDWPGSASFTASLALFTVGVMQASALGWTSLATLGLLFASVVMLLVFIAIERRVRRPMLDLSLFRYKRFVGVQMLPVATCYGYVVLLVMLPIRFIGIEGHSELEAGLMMMALSLPLLVIPAVAASLAHRYSPGLLSAGGLVVAAMGLLWLAQIPPGQSLRTWALPMIVVGVGNGVPWGLMDGLSVSVVPRDRAGMASGIFSTTRVAGECIALALMVAVLAALLHGQVHATWPTVDADRLGSIAQRLAGGDLARAQALLADTGDAAATHAGLIRIYGDAFRWLAYLLAGITALSATVVFFLLGSPEGEEVDGSSVGEGL